MISLPLRLGFLASRNGTAMRAIVNAARGRALDADPRLVVSNNRNAAALAYAEAHGLPTLCVPTQSDPQAADERLCEALEAAGVELVVLSGYLRQLGPKTLHRFHNRILNIHPGPLPAFGGQGMYGRRVHEAVIAAGAAASEICIHLVDEEYDRGPVLARRSVPLQPGETAESLEGRILALEPPFFVETLRAIAEGACALP
ncbi:MAG TPA: formyltransferase family protein [Phenylobacterium sp.]